jgi:hypothetical protein
LFCVLNDKGCRKVVLRYRYVVEEKLNLVYKVSWVRTVIPALCCAQDDNSKKIKADGRRGRMEIVRD